MYIDTHMHAHAKNAGRWTCWSGQSSFSLQHVTTFWCCFLFSPSWFSAKSFGSLCFYHYFIYIKKITTTKQQSLSALFNVTCSSGGGTLKKKKKENVLFFCKIALWLDYWETKASPAFTCHCFSSACPSAAFFDHRLSNQRPKGLLATVGPAPAPSQRSFSQAGQWRAMLRCPKRFS